MRRKIALLLMIMLLCLPAEQAGAATDYVQKTVTPEQARAACNAALEYANHGVYFKLGGQVTVEAFAANPTPDQGIDASGLVVNVYRSVLGDIRFAAGGGEKPLLVADVASSHLFNWNTLSIGLDQLQAGDLLFFKNTAGRISGVGIFVKRQGDLVHFVIPSSSKGRVVETFYNIRNEYWQNQFAGAGRLVYWQR